MKTYVLDASALFGFLEHKPGAPKVKEIIKEGILGHSRILMSAVNYGEVYGLLLRSKPPDEAVRIMSALGPLPIELHDANQQRCFRAIEIKTQYKLYYVDAFAAALAVEHKATLVTSDSDFRRLGRAIAVMWLKP